MDYEILHSRQVVLCYSPWLLQVDCFTTPSNIALYVPPLSIRLILMIIVPLLYMICYPLWLLCYLRDMEISYPWLDRYDLSSSCGGMSTMSIQPFLWLIRLYILISLCIGVTTANTLYRSQFCYGTVLVLREGRPLNGKCRWWIRRSDQHG